MATNANQTRNLSLFLLPNFSEDPPSQLECMQIDLVTEEKTKITFTNPSVTESIFLESQSCISHGSTVLIVGGLTAAAEEPIEAIHKFDILAKTWTRGPNMTVKRSGFAGGVFGNRLYIAGGFGGSGVGNVRETDVYDFITGELRQAAQMPISVMVKAFFTLSGKLYVAGSVHNGNLKTAKYLSYCPDRNEWTEEDSWLRQVLKEIGDSAVVSNKFVAAGDNELYMLEASDEVRVSSYIGDEEPSFLMVSKLDKSTLKWKRVQGMLDGEFPGNCQCPVMRELWFHAAGTKVVVMMHEDDEHEGRVTPVVDEITAVSLLCPSAWSSAIING